MNKRQLTPITLGVFLVLSIMNFIWVQPTQAQSEPIIVTIVGNGIPGYTGDGGTALAAQLNFPSAIVFDDKGNMYIADSSNHCVRKIDTNGLITTFAGNGTKGYTGDGGPAIFAQLNNPNALAFDSKGNLYIADLLGYCVRKVDIQGNISTVAGIGISGYSGEGGSATSAKLTGTFGLIVDKDNNLYISDFTRVRTVDQMGIIRTYAGTGKFDHTGYGGPAIMATLGAAFGLAFDNNNCLYFADNGNNCISKIDSAGNISTVAGIGIPNVGGYSGDGGQATSARLNRPKGVSFDKAGNMYIADSSNNCIRKVDTNGIISTVIGNGTKGYSGDGSPATSASLNGPSAIAFDAGGNIYIADCANHCVRKVILAGSGQENSDISNNIDTNKSTPVILPEPVLAAPNVVLNGNKLSFDVSPIIENGRTLVPLRTIFEALGATVSWDEDSQTVTAVKGLNTIILQIGSATATKNGQVVNLDIPGKIVNGRTLVPLRFVSEAMGCKVDWVDETQTVVITNNSDPNSKTIIYSDPKGRFAISYPNDWSVKTDDPNVDLFIFPSPKESITGELSANICISVRSLNGQNINMDIIKTNSLMYINKLFSDVKVISEKEVTISGTLGFERLTTVTMGKTVIMSKDIWVIKNDFTYEIAISSVPQENRKLLNKFDSVVNTIKIVDPIN